MKAIVLSGGGNRGPLQVGAMRALLHSGLRPDFFVGSSAGAINASFAAAHGFTVITLDNLEEQWRNVDTQTVYPGSMFSVAWRLYRKHDSLYHSSGLRDLIAQGMPDGIDTFGDLNIPLYVPAADLRSNRLFMFGADPHAPLLDAVLASASVPVIHPPVHYRELQLVDGGILANVAASYAMDKGATEVYVINVSSAEQEPEYAEGVVDVAFRSLNTMIVQSLLRDLDRAREVEDVDLHHIYIDAFAGVWFKDFSHTEEMFHAGYEATVNYLQSPSPLVGGPDGAIDFAPSGPVVPGVEEIEIPLP